MGAAFPERYGPAGVTPEGSCRKDQKAGNHDLPGRMTALEFLHLKERRLRMGEGRMIVFLKYAKDCLLLGEEEKFLLPSGKQKK